MRLRSDPRLRGDPQVTPAPEHAGVGVLRFHSRRASGCASRSASRAANAKAAHAPLPARATSSALAAAVLLAVALGCSACLSQPAGGPQEVKRDLFGRPLEESKGGPIAPSFEPVVLQRPDGVALDRDLRERRELDPEDAGWAEKLELSRGLMESGEDEQALGVIDATLAQGPPAAWAGRFRNQRIELKVRRTEQTLVRVEARPVKDVVGFLTEVEFRIRIRNVSQEDLVFGPPPAAATQAGRPLAGGASSSPNAISLEVVRRDRDVTAALLERRWSTTVFLQRPGDAPLRIRPGESREFPVRIPAEDVGPPIAGVRVLEVSGTLRPTHMTLGGAPELMALRVRRGRVVVLPEGYEPLAADPARGLEQAVLLGAAPHVLVATEFLPRSYAPQAALLLARALSEGDPLLVTAAQGAFAMLRERCVGDPLAPLVDPVMASLESRPERARDLIGGLMALTDARLASDVRLWQDWWRRTRGTSPVVTAPQEAGTSGPGTAREPR